MSVEDMPKLDVEDAGVSVEDLAAAVSEALPAKPPPKVPELTKPSDLARCASEVLRGDGIGHDKVRTIFNLTCKALGMIGSVVRNANGQCYYFYRLGPKLLNLETRSFENVLSGLSGLATSEKEFKHVLALLKTAASSLVPFKIKTFSSWADNGDLLINLAGKEVFRLGADGVFTTEANGESDLFYTLEDPSPLAPDITATGELSGWFPEQFSFANTENLSAEDHRIVLQVGIMSAFLPAESHVIGLHIGPPEAGKTTGSNMVGKLLLGRDRFSSFPIKENGRDDVVAALTNDFVVGLDNLDTDNDWIVDEASAWSTGATHKKRLLYTNNELGTFDSRAQVLSITSNDQHFTDLGLCQRSVPLRYDFPETATEDAVLYRQVEEHRPRIIGEMMAMLSKTLASMKVNIPPKMHFRMVAFAELGWHLHKAGCFEGKTEADWIALLSRLSKAQLELAGERDSTVEIVRELMDMNVPQKETLLAIAGLGGSDSTARKAFARHPAEIYKMQMKDFYKVYALCASNANYPFVKSPNALSRKLTAFKRAIESGLRHPATLTMSKQNGRTFVTLMLNINIEFEAREDVKASEASDTLDGKEAA